MLNFPLLNSNPDCKHDIMLATAFAFGEGEIINEAIELYTSHKLGVALMKLNNDTVGHIIATLKAAGKALEAEDTQPGLSMELLHVFQEVCVSDADIANGIPTVIPRILERADFSAISCAAECFGVYAIPMNSFRHKRTSRTAVEFVYTRSFSPDEAILFTNFQWNFRMPVTWGEDGSYYEFSQAKPTSNRVKPRIPEVDPIVEVYAMKLAIRSVNIAATRLEYLQSKLQAHQSLSLLHMAVNAGYDGHLLQSLADDDERLISMNQHKLETSLQAALEKSVPPSKEQSPVLHREEVSIFVHKYIRLLKLSYCDNPLLDSSPPSQYVPDKSVLSEARENTPWESDATRFHGTRRLLEKGERDRIDGSRLVSAPKAHVVAAAGCCLWILMSWLWFCVVTKLFFIYKHEIPPDKFGLVSLISCQPLTLWPLHELSNLLKTPLRLAHVASYWMVLLVSTETLIRHICIRRGYPTPFDRELQTLREECGRQYRDWSIRLAVQEFHNARARKQISSRELLKLLQLFSTIHDEGNGTGIVDVKLPGTIEEAEDFLNVIVDEEEEEVLESEATSASPLDALASVERLVDECLQYGAGDRVVVDITMYLKIPNDEEDTNDNAALAALKSAKGSITTCFPGHCLVHFDGQPSVFPHPIPLEKVSPLEEYTNLDAQRLTIEAERGEPYIDENNRHETLSKEEPDNIESEKSVPPDSTIDKTRRSRTVTEALEDGGWEVDRQKNHLFFKRRIKAKDGRLCVESLTLSKTPSDRRASRNALAQIRRLNAQHQAAIISDDEEDEVTAKTTAGKPGGGARKVSSKAKKGAVGHWCSACGKEKSKSDFTRSQLKKTLPKCKACTVG